MSGPCSKTQTGCDIPGVSFLGGDKSRHLNGKRRESQRRADLLDGRQGVHSQPCRLDSWIKALEVILGELMHGKELRRELTRDQAIKFWAQKRSA